MKAVQYNQCGSASVLKWVEVDQPRPLSKEVLVQVAYASVNHGDIHFRKGIPGIPTLLPKIPGMDGSGKVVDTGSEVHRSWLGKRVLINPSLSLPKEALVSKETVSVDHRYRVFGKDTPGTYAEYCVVPESNLIELPDGIAYPEAAAFSVVYLTAFHMLEKAALSPGEKVFIPSIGSGIGTALLDLLSKTSLKILGSTSSKLKIEKANLHYPFGVFFLNSEDLLEVSYPKDFGKVDVIFDHIGGANLSIYETILERRGRVVTCGATSGFDAQKHLSTWIDKELSITGVTMGNPRQYRRVLELFFERKLSPQMDSFFSMEEAWKAHQYIEDRRSFGKVLLKNENFE